MKGYQDCQYLLNKLALPFLEKVLFKNVYSDLKAPFLQFVSSEEREVLMEVICPMLTLMILWKFSAAMTVEGESQLRLFLQYLMIGDLRPAVNNEHRFLDKFLRYFIKWELDESKLQKCKPFCTGSDLIVANSVNVEFEEMTEFTRRPIGQACGNILHIADTYENFPYFRSEFNAVLESNVWVMDIV